MTRTRALPSAQVQTRRLATCQHLSDAPPTSIVVERTGVAGESLTYAGEAGLYACDSIPNPALGALPEDSGSWCGGSFGRVVNGRLTDPRLSLCQSEHGGWTAFVWVEPLSGARWVVLHAGRRREVYPVDGPVPVRVAQRVRLENQETTASFDIEQYARDGDKLDEYTLEAAISG